MSLLLLMGDQTDDGDDTGGGGGPPAFSPLSLPDYSVWYGVPDSTQVSQAAGLVSQWNDKTGLGNHATQSTQGSKPDLFQRTVNGKPCLSLDGVNDSMSVPPGVFQTGAMTVITVHVPNSNLTTQQVLATDGLGGGSNRTQIRNQSADFGATSMARANPSVSMPIISIGRVSGSGSGVTERLRINNDPEIVTTTTRNATPITRADLGVFGQNSTGYFYGALCEVIVYKRELTDAEVNQLMAYLMDNWVSDMKAVTVQNRYPNGRIAAGGVRDGAVNRFAHIMATDSAALFVSFSASYLDTTNVLNLGNAYTIDAVSVESPLGNVVPMPFYGGASARSQIVNNNASDVHTAMLLPSAFGLSKFTKGDIYTIKTHFTLPAGGFLPSSDVLASDYAGNQMIFYEKALNTPSDTDLPGAFTFSGAGTPVNASSSMNPIVLGIPIGSAKVWAGIGDSITWASNDNTSGGIFGRGYFQRSMRSATNDDLLPSINFSKQGAFLVAFTGATVMRAYYRYANNVSIGMGTNDFAASGTGTTAAAYRTAMDTITGLFVNLGFNKRLAIKLGPRVATSSDSFATAAGQTPNAGWMLGQPPYQGNDELDLMVIAGTLTSAVDFPANRDAGNLALWNSDGLPFTFTNDGLHPVSQSHENRAVVLRPQYRAA